LSSAAVAGATSELLTELAAVSCGAWTSAVVWKFVVDSALEAAADLVGLDAATGGDELPAAFDTGLDVDDLQQHTHTTV